MPYRPSDSRFARLRRRVLAREQAQVVRPAAQAPEAPARPVLVLVHSRD